MEDVTGWWVAPVEGSVASDQLLAMNQWAAYIGMEAAIQLQQDAGLDSGNAVMNSYASVAAIFLNIGAFEPERARALIRSVGMELGEGEASDYLAHFERGEL